MNENLKFKIRRLKQDFEEVLDELSTQVVDLEAELKNSFSEVYVNELEEEIQELEDKLNDRDKLIEELKKNKDE